MVARPGEEAVVLLSCCWKRCCPGSGSGLLGPRKEEGGLLDMEAAAGDARPRCWRPGCCSMQEEREEREVRPSREGFGGEPAAVIGMMEIRGEIRLGFG